MMLNATRLVRFDVGCHSVGLHSTCLVKILERSQFFAKIACQTQSDPWVTHQQSLYCKSSSGRKRNILISLQSGGCAVHGKRPNGVNIAPRTEP
jgi:hypothetical protein